MRAPRRADNGGYASGLEKTNGLVLEKSGLEFWYESGPCAISYTLPIRGGVCSECGAKHVVSEHLYTADFAFRSKSGKLIIVECKGHPLAWTGKTRSKHQAIKKQYPEMDLRFIFNNKHGKISKKSKTTNAEWCRRQGFQCESNVIPRRWLDE
jgi:hypothetical protein